ncbi:MAG: NACHT domain-containing protein [Pyrinomonadaceae bacterium MAG19_C2-C3]|nr:NACHT domain-containing protein [Pyrinomonadaceae bacterium MAG19_C2-C3]
MPIEQLIPLAGSAGVWAWSKYGEDIIQSLVTKLGSKALNKTTETAKAAWERVEWQSAANKYLSKIQKLYGTIRVLGMPEPISLEGIFTDVLILDRPTAYRRYDIKELHEDPRQLEQDAVARMSGLSLVKQSVNGKLFILGKPGAGKTTFLKYIALQATEGKLDKVPIFISLKEWADSGLTLKPFIVKQFEICDFPDALPFVERMLDKGDAVVLFDGLDEVNQEEDRRSKTITEIRDFSNQYYKAQCLITCRIAATDYTFEHFTYVELADFNDEQIRTFASKWFKDDPWKYEMFEKEISKPENNRLYELASVPILLTLLCLSFDETLEFPQRRVEVYEEAVDALLKKWDASRSIKRDEIYRGLTHNRKRQMLARVAAITFQEDKYFVPQGELARHIVNYLRQLPSTELSDDIDGEAVLKAVEAQHGILSERAHRIYSFSHLTFQEYFAAKQVVDDASGNALRRLLSAETLLSDRWREVILMTASLLDNADEFFSQFQNSIIGLMIDDPHVIELFTWADRKAQAVGTPEEIIEGRLYYLSLALIFDTDRSLNRERARSCQLAYVHAEELGRTIKSGVDLFDNRLTSLPLTINQHLAVNTALELDRAFDLSVALKRVDLSLTNPRFALDLQLSKLQFLADLLRYSVEENSRRVLTPKFTTYFMDIREVHRFDFGSKLEETLKRFTSSETNIMRPAWAKFVDDLRDVLKQEGIGYEWNLKKHQIEVISRVFRASGLMYDCLQLAAVTNRKAIADGLLFPPKLSASI